MPQGELWEATPRDKLRAEAFERTPWEKRWLSNFTIMQCNVSISALNLGMRPPPESKKTLKSGAKKKRSLKIPLSNNKKTTQISHDFSKTVFFITVCAEKFLIFKK